MTPPPHAEDDRLLDHEYDGIQEYDNPLPGWWVAIFWITIFFSGFYIFYYHIGVGQGIVDQFNSDAAAFYEWQSAKYADLEVTEAEIAKRMQEKDLMAGMAQLFSRKCSTCHGDQGQGNACPNLTDNAWIHGGSLMEIFTTIRDGVSGKEMKAWLPELGKGNVMFLAAYVGTLRGKNLPGRAAEGKPYLPGGK